MPDEVVQAVNDQDDIVREHRGPPDLTDIVTVAVMMAAYASSLPTSSSTCRASRFHRLGLDAEKCQLVMRRWREIGALRVALGS